MLTLSGKTKKGKERIKRDGAEWEILETRGRVLFSDKLGPWWLIVPKNDANPFASRQSRWVHSKNDHDFEITENDHERN